MNRILSLLLFVIMAHGAFGQMAKVGYTALTLADLEARYPVPYERVEVIYGTTNAPWESSRFFAHDPFSSATPSYGYVHTNSANSGRYIAIGAAPRDVSIERTAPGEITIRTNVIVDGMINLGDEWKGNWTPFWLNVKDYGAVGDGVVDDTDAIQSAIDSAGALYVVYFPPGNYRTTSRIDLNDGTRIRGDGWNTVIKADHDGNGFSYAGLPGGLPRAHYIHMQGLRLTTGTGKSPQNALNLIDVSDSVFIDINLSYGSGNGWLKGVYTYGNYDISDTNNVVGGGNWRNTFQKCRLYVRGGPGSWAFYGDGGPSSAGGPNDTVLFDCYFNGLGGITDPSEGLVFGRNCNRFTITHSGFEGYATNGVRIGTGSQSFTIAFNRFEEQIAGRNIIRADEWTPDGHLILGNMMLLQGGPGSLTRIYPIDFPGNILDNSYGGAQQIMGPGLLVGAHPTHASMTYLPLGTSKLILGGNFSSDTNVLVIGSFDGTNNPRASIVQLSTQSGTNRTNHLTFTSAASTGASEMELATGTKTNVHLASHGTGIGWKPELGAEFSVGGRITAGQRKILSNNFIMPTNSVLIVGDGGDVDTAFVAMNYDGGTNSRIWMGVKSLRGRIQFSGSAGGSFPVDVYSGNTLVSTFDNPGLEIPVGKGISINGVYKTAWPTEADTLDGQDGSWYLARSNHIGTQAWSTITNTPTTLFGYGITDTNFLPLSGGTVTGGLYLTGLPSDVSSVASYRFMVRDPGDNQIKPMTAAYALGFLDAAPSSHNHAASAITSGTMIADRLGTGTPNTNTFLQGNGTGNSPVWATIPSTPSPTNGIADAPADGVLYGRLNNTWTGVDIGLISGMSAFGVSWIQDVTSASDGRNTLELVGGSAATIDSPAQHAVRINSGGSPSTRHRINLIAGAGISLSLTDDAGDDESDTTIRMADGDYGAITVSSSGAAWAIDDAAVTYAKIQDVSAASRLLGRGSSSGSGDVQELTLGGGLAMTGTVLHTNPVTVASSKLVGRGSASSGPAEEITLGTGLSMSGTTLSATASGDTAAFAVAAFTAVEDDGDGVPVPQTLDGANSSGVVSISRVTDTGIYLVVLSASQSSSPYKRVEICTIATAEEVFRASVVNIKYDQLSTGTSIYIFNQNGNIADGQQAMFRIYSH